MQSGEGGRGGGPASWVLPWVTHCYQGARGHLRARKANPGIGPGMALENPYMSTSRPGAGDTRPRVPTSQNSPLPRAARDLDPHVLIFQCLGRFRNPNRTSVCRTQNRQAHIGTEGQGSKPKQPQERDDQEGSRVGKRQGRGPGHGSSLIPGIIAPVWVMCGTRQAHACARDSYTALPGLWAEAGTQAHPSPEV